MGSRAGGLWKRQGGDTFTGDGGEDGSSGYDYGSYSDYGYGTYGDNVGFWWTPAGMAVRYTIVGLLFAALLFFFVGGYFHARRRLQRGLPPLSYHRWMVGRAYRSYPAETVYYQQPGTTYRMDQYEHPPPAYTATTEPPPVYQPPEGATKVAANQTYTHVRPAGSADENGPTAPGATVAPASRP
ncbi:hypothetical protein KC332_g12227 [Hortaea werneckii]|nr:hypothetical protein KC358_g11101 [Hortaea werneckii]KAI6818077.1 hypothetical protein KC350_g10432 [Hortaea werneckii]KAI6901498.1 hypothetical protein KC348_g16458 [Hortaea werneckii]KAI6929592.1 hypothetical protein KC341_g10764 [Hortaea werneckii]KAI6961798.1 hypothetical protein KC321_g12125 [Hortaea werneckii]